MHILPGKLDVKEKTPTLAGQPVHDGTISHQRAMKAMKTFTDVQILKSGGHLSSLLPFKSDCPLLILNFVSGRMRMVHTLKYEPLNTSRVCKPSPGGHGLYR